MDAVAAADKLRSDVTGELDELLRPVDEMPSNVFVGWVAALDATGCPARYRSDGEAGWGFPGWSPMLAGGAVARGALVRHCAIASLGTECPQPLTMVKDWLRDAARAPTSPMAEWIGECAAGGDRASIAATAAAATRWLSGFLRVIGWPLPERLGVVSDCDDGPLARRWAKRWRPHRDAVVTVASSPDGVLGKVAPSGDFSLVVHRAATPVDDVLRDRAAFEAAAGALSSGMVARQVIVTSGDCGEQIRVPIDTALLERGAAMVVGVVRQRIHAMQPDWDMSDATPSAACHYCAQLDDCPAGQEWTTGPGLWRSGLPVLAEAIPAPTTQARS